MDAKEERAADRGLVKLHVFEPSGRKVWTVVGSGGEYWVDPDLGFCTCPAFYFSKQEGRQNCYHLESVRAAAGGKDCDKTGFEDAEYASFMASLAPDPAGQPAPK